MARPALMPQLRADLAPRWRALALLAAATAAMALAAGTALIWRQGTLDRAPHARLLLPSLASLLPEADRIVYTFGEGLKGVSTVTLVQDGGVWTVAERFGHPADPALVRRVGLGLAGLEIVEPRTARPRWHRRLGLLTPEDLGSAVRVAAFRGEEPLGAILLGKQPEGVTAVSGQGLIYARHVGQDQSWLVRGRLPLHRAPGAWLLQPFDNIPAGLVREVHVAPRGQEAYTIARATAEDDFALVSPAAAAVPDHALARSADALPGLLFEDVVPRDALEFTDAFQARFDMFDGLHVMLDMVGAGSAVWARITAHGDTAATADAARRINARAQNWAYKVPFERAFTLTSSLEDLRKAPPS